ncbi:MAG TPA: AAA family ATPase, partial [Actinomycetes bacterium]
MATGDSVPVGGAQRLVGRDADLDRLSRLLDQHQLVTVAGVGGVGKTSLAAAAAHRRPAAHVVFCSLGDVDTGEAVRHLVAARLGTVLSPGVPLGRAVPPTPDGSGVLVLLDNCEHVLDAAAEVAEELCTAGAHVTVLTTSREPLRIAEEHVVVLGPLTVPGAEDEDAATRDAVVLF